MLKNVGKELHAIINDKNIANALLDIDGDMNGLLYPYHDSNGGFVMITLHIDDYFKKKSLEPNQHLEKLDTFLVDTKLEPVDRRYFIKLIKELKIHSYDVLEVNT